MIERVVEYLANALWQLPLLAFGAWWLLRAGKFGPLVQHRVWVAVLGMGVVLPLARVAPPTVVVRPTASALSVADAGGPDALPVMAVRVSERAGVSGSIWWRDALRRRSVEVSAGVARVLVGLYFAVMLLGLMRIARGWNAARRLVGSADDVSMRGRLGLLLEECGRKVGVDVPRVVESGEVSSPAVVGKVLLLPDGFVRYSEEEMRAALLHEFAHLRRRDYGANVLCEMAGLPVVWHPVSYAVRQRIRSTREMVCDEVAAGTMGSAAMYAGSLMGLAAKACMGDAVEQPMAVGLFTNNNLEERVMRLMETKQVIDMRAKLVRVMGAAAGMTAIVALAAMVHITPAMAQAVGPSAPQATTVPAIRDATQAPPAVPAVAAAPEPPAVPEPPAPAAFPAPPVLPAPAILPAPQVVVFGGGESEHEPLAMAHGQKSSIDAEPGAYLHEWKGADGQPFKILNRQRAEPTTAEKKHYEELFHRQMVEMEKELAKLKQEAPWNEKEIADAQRQANEASALMQSPELQKQMVDAQRQANEASALMQSPEMQKQMAELKSPAFQKQLDEQIKALKANLDAANSQALTAQKKFGVLDSVEMQQRMAEMQKQLSDAHLDRLHAQLEIKSLDSAEMKRQMAELDREISKLTSKEVRKQIDEQMKAARQHLENAQKVLEEERVRDKD